MTSPQIEKGQRLTLSLVSWGRLGEAMAYYPGPGGQEVFVMGGIPGERVVAEVLRVRRRYVGAQVVEVLEPAPGRVQPRCPYYGTCTGCQWQHLDYPAQLEAKRDKVIDALARVGGIYNPPVAAVLPSPQQYGYRNHARFTIGRSGDLGFVNRETRQFVRIDNCMLMHQGINDLLTQLQDKCGETTQLAIRAGAETGDYLIQPTLKNPEITLPTGQKHYLDSVNDRSFRVASPSFFQVNNQQTVQLVQAVRQALDLKGDEVLLDAYTGVGTFAILLAPYVGRVIAVEESSAAVADARENAAGLSNVGFILGKSEDVLGQLEEKPDVVVLDPPRAGCQVGALESLIKLAPPRVVYVSCDPETLGRDLKILCAGNYRIESMQPLDMFPQTHHVECLTVLTRLTPEDVQPLILASGSPRRRELLAGLGWEFQVIPSDAPELQLPGESAQEMVQRLSREKAQAVADGLEQGYVIGADSTVVLDGKVFGKPEDEDEARRMLLELRGTRHQVSTGLTVIDRRSGRSLTDCLTSDIQMRDFSDAEMEESIASGVPLDKAGAYAVQDQEFRPAAMLTGCYSNVVGLPLCRLFEMLEELGYPVPPRQSCQAPEGCLIPCPFTPRRTS